MEEKWCNLLVIVSCVSLILTIILFNLIDYNNKLIFIPYTLLTISLLSVLFIRRYAKIKPVSLGILLLFIQIIFGVMLYFVKKLLKLQFDTFLILLPFAILGHILEKNAEKIYKTFNSFRFNKKILKNK